MNKTEMIAALDQLRADWQAVLAQLDAEQMEQPGAMGDWAFRDIVSHLTGWRKRTVAMFEAAANGTEPEPPEWPAALGTEEESEDNVPGINNWFYEKDRPRPLADVLAESEQVFRRLDAALRRVPEGDLNVVGRFAWLEEWPLTLDGALEHYYVDHAPDIKAWLAAQRPRE
ncbi:MAG: ClbS/DfsB family four-helix bundle protein [Chloroflexota bacterium]|nr:ClbS/DfsB family four-helix bundle protein [Chloroflexota bacterium]